MRKLLALLVGTALGCSADLTIPLGSQLTCESTDDCPEGFRCASALGQCIRGDADDTPPSIVGTATITPEVAGLDATVRVQFTVSEPLAHEPVVSLASAGRPPLALVAQEGETYTFERAISGSEGDGVWTVLALLVDESGVASTDIALGALRIDLRAPAVLAADTRYDLGPEGILTTPLAAKEGTELTVNLFADEPLSTTTAAELAIECDGEAPILLTGWSLASSPTYVAFAHTWTCTSATEQACAMTATLFDKVGNVSDATPLATPLLVDCLAPDTNTIDASLLMHLRAPWGAKQTGYQPAQYLSSVSVGESESPTTPITSQAFSADVARVRVYDENDVLLGASQPIGDDGFSAARLSLVDSTRIFVRPVDHAGNEGEASLVSQSEWVATLGAKQAGNTLTNPHRVTQHPQFTGRLSPYSGTAERAVELHEEDGTLAITRTLGSWRRVERADYPRRANHALVFDSWRGEVVLAGGEDVGSFNAPSRWNGHVWQVIPNNDAEGDGSPEEMFNPQMAFDAKRGVTVYFGGAIFVGDSADKPLDHLWEFNGTSWARRCDGTPEDDVCPIMPPPTYRGAMAFDALRGVSVLYGGCANEGCSTPRNDVWTWDGTSWTQHTPVGTLGVDWPTPRFEHAMAFDMARSVVVVHGGRPNVDRQTWEWDGEGWRAASSSGPSRYGSAMAYDANLGAIVMMGGLEVVECEEGQCGPFFRWDGNTWHVQDYGILPPDEVVWGRSYHGLAFDSARGELFVSPGFAEDFVTCTLDGCRARGGASWPQPGKRSAPSIAYHPQRDAYLFFGGTGTTAECGTLYCNDAFELMGDRWQPIPSGPSARQGAGATYLPGTGIVVLGGYNGSILGDLWIWNGTWSNPTTTGSPGSRATLDVALTAQGSIIVEGNYYKTTMLTGTTWSSPYEWETNISGPAMAYDAARGEVIFFGGSDESSSAGPMATTRRFVSSGWETLSVSGPDARRDAAMAYDSARQVITLFGGTGEGLYYNDTWEWDGEAWTRVAVLDPEGDLGPSRATVMSDGPGRLVMNAFGNFGTWEWWSAGTARAGQVADIDARLLGLNDASLDDVIVSAKVGSTSLTGSGCTPEHGAMLYVTLDDRFVPVASSSGSLAEPSEVTWRMSDDAEWSNMSVERRTTRAFLMNQALHFALVQQAPSGCKGPAGLGTDYVEARVRYHR